MSIILVYSVPINFFIIKIICWIEIDNVGNLFAIVIYFIFNFLYVNLIYCIFYRSVVVCMCSCTCVWNGGKCEISLWKSEISLWKFVRLTVNYSANILFMCHPVTWLTIMNLVWLKLTVQILHSLNFRCVAKRFIFSKIIGKIIVY